MPFTKEQFIEMYENQKLSVEEIGKIYGITRQMVSYWAHKHGYVFKSKIHTEAVEVTKEQLSNMYLTQRMSQKEIAKALNRSQCYVRARMKEFGINSRESGSAQAEKRGIPFNEKFFDEWSHDMAYVFGLLYADGNIFNYRISLTLKEEDVELLYAVADALSFPREKLRKSYCKEFDTHNRVLSVSRRYTANKLMSMGIVPCKSKVKEFPSVPPEFLWDFIRGYFDGNGSLSCGELSFSCGSPLFTASLQQILANELGCYVGVYEDLRTGTVNYSIRITTSHAIKEFRRRAYASHGICLRRKLELFK